MTQIKRAIEDFRPDQRLVDERGPTPERKAKLRVSPIALAVSDDRLTREQGLAAEKLQAHWALGGLIDSIPSADLAREVFGAEGFSVMPRSESQAFHRDRYRKAMAMIASQLGGLSVWVAEQIVCHEKGFVEVGGVFGHKFRNKAADVSRGILVPVLNLLCKEWGIE